MNKKIELPVVNLRDVVFYPGMECNLYFGREFTIRAIKHAKAATQNRVVVVTQTSVENLKPFGKTDAYSVGTICKIIQSIELTDGTVKAIFHATESVKILKSETRDGIRYVVGKKIERTKPEKSLIDEKIKNDALKLLVRWNPELALKEEATKFDAIKRESVFDKFLDLALEIACSSRIGFELRAYEKTKPEILKLLDSRILKRQKILEQPNRKKQLSMLLEILKEELHLELKTSRLRDAS
jgi:ATP-dependent Lon protease